MRGFGHDKTGCNFDQDWFSEMSVAEEIGQMVSYAFLSHRLTDDALLEDADSGVETSAKTTLVKNVQRKEAFVELLLEYLFKTGRGPDVLLQAVHKTVEGYEVAVHTRQARSDDRIPDFEVVYGSAGNPRTTLTILLELKVQAPVKAEQDVAYRKIRANLSRTGTCYLVALSPTWNTRAQFSAEVGTETEIQSLSFADLAAAARSLRLPADQIALWEMFETTAESMKAPVSPLPSTEFLNAPGVARQMEAWFNLFEQMAKYLETDSDLDQQVGFNDCGNFDSGVSLDAWGIDFGMSGYFDDSDAHRRTPIWFTRKTTAEPAWSTTRLGLGADHEKVKQIMDEFVANRQLSNLPATREFVGEPATREFEFAREILWAAMQGAAESAKKVKGVSVQQIRPSEMSGYGLQFAKGLAEIEVRIVTRDSKNELHLGIKVGEHRVDPRHYLRGSDFAAEVASRVELALIRN
jgi:hypothetical protein